MNLAGMIDHTLLKPETAEKDIVDLCHEAVQNQFAAVCVNPIYIRTASRMLHGTKVIPCTVIGFPLGANLTEIKVHEIMAAKAHGAREADVVINIGRIKSGDWESVKMDVERVVQASHSCSMGVKIIVETTLLTEDEKKRASEVVSVAGADFIKTCTGFNGGATPEDVRKLKEWTGSWVKVKASGGIRTREAALELIEAGADRLGTSSGIEIVRM